MIEINQVSKSYGHVEAVNKVSFEVPKGKTFVLLGTSGCGKTTLLRMINGLVKPDSGNVIIDGTDIDDHNIISLRRKIGYVIQDIGLFPHYTVFDNIALVPRLVKTQEKEISRRVAYFLDKLNIPFDTYAHKYPHELSGGQQQRVGLARALIAAPPILLMDEPFGALDPITRREIRNDFNNLEELSEKTTVMVTHDILEAVLLGDHICLMDKATVQQIGSSKEIIFQPKNEFVRSFISGRLVELELHVTKLKDVLDFLPPHNDVSIPTVKFGLHDSLMSILTSLSNDSDSNHGLINDGRVRIVFDFASIMEAFSVFKSNPNSRR